MCYLQSGPLWQRIASDLELEFLRFEGHNQIYWPHKKHPEARPALCNSDLCAWDLALLLCEGGQWKAASSRVQERCAFGVCFIF